MNVDIKMGKEQLAKAIKSIQEQWRDLNDDLTSRYSAGTVFLIKMMYIILFILAAFVVGVSVMVLQIISMFIKFIVWFTAAALAGYMTIHTILPWFDIDLIAWIGQLL